MNRAFRFLVSLAVFLLAAPAWSGDAWRVGYGLCFSVDSLDASGVDARFPDLPAGGHASRFYLEAPLSGPFYWNLSPGAANFEKGSSAQFTYQYNLLSLGAKGPWRLFPKAELGLGGCIAALSSGDSSLGQVQEGVLLRRSAFMWTAAAGLGWRFGPAWEAAAELRGLGFLDADLSRLDSLALGFTLSFAL